MLLCILSVCCFILAFIPKVILHCNIADKCKHVFPQSETTWILLIYLLGKCVVGACFQVIWLITSEMYPTNLRGQALGACSTVARIFGLICPFFSNLAIIWQPLPMVLLGTPAAVGGVLSFLLLPETSDLELPQSMLDANELLE